MSNLVWPEKPLCHGPYSTYSGQEIVWRKPKGKNELRTCSWCGSMHPEDLVEWLEHRGMKLEGADYKYGWCHKFYLAGNSPKYPIKFYNDHLRDLDGETFEYVADLIEKHARIRFSKKDGQLYWRAPYYGYQHYDPSDYKMPKLPDEEGGETY